MSQLDAVPTYRGDQLTQSEEDVSGYHGQLLEQLRHVEDNINKFAIQNYAASGAVVLAYLADKAPLWATVIIVALLNINFAIACARVDKLFTMHCIVINFWLANRPELLKRLQANSVSNEVLASTTFPRWVSYMMLLAQFLPILFLLLAAPFNEYTPFCNGPGDVKSPRVIVASPSSRFCPWSTLRSPHCALRGSGEPI
jgi:hypothetical protein